jgi:hypothetical protein
MVGKTRKNKIICYDGIGSHKSGIHTPKNFMKRLRKEIRPCMDPIRRKEIPHYCYGISTGNVNELVRWSGAVWSTRKKCRNDIQAGKRADKERERLAKIPGTKEHQVVLDNIKLILEDMTSDSKRDYFRNSKFAKKYLTKSEIKSFLSGCV